MEVKVLKDILNANNRIAEQNRQLLAEKRVMAVNVMSSPGSGKTTLILRTVEELGKRVGVGVIEGDVSSSIDADKLSRAGIASVQINTGGGCHLDASMVNPALASLPLEDIDILFLENVGNLICPGGFDLGERLKVVVLSTPEGDDKPHKYPALFAATDVLVVSKTDLLPHVSFDLDTFRRTFHGINQKAALFAVSGVSGEGIKEWGAWLLERLAEVSSGQPAG